MSHVDTGKKDPKEDSPSDSHGEQDDLRIEEDDFIEVGRGGKPKPVNKGPGLAASALSEAPAAAPAAAGAGVTSSEKVRARSPPAPKRTGTAGPRQPSPAAPRGLEDKIDTLTAAVGSLTTECHGLRERIAGLEAGTDGEESERGSGYESEAASEARSVSSRTTTASLDTHDKESGSEKSYLRVQPDCGFWNARELHHDKDQKPHRYSLHGNEWFDALREAGRRGGGGSIGFALRWLEPSSTYLKTGTDGLHDTLRAFEELLKSEEGCTADDLYDVRDELVACFNTLRGAFSMVNTLRGLFVERAKIVADKGADKGAKRRQEWVESQLDDYDYAPADVEPRLRKLKAEYDSEAQRADLKRAASAGGAAARDGSGGRHARDDDGPSRGGRTKTQKRRERRERAGGDDRGSRSPKRRSARRGDPPARDGDGGGRRRSPGKRREGDGHRGSRQTESRRERRDGGGSRSPARRSSRPAGGGGRNNDGRSRGGGGRSERRDSSRSQRDDRRGDDDSDSWSES